MAFVSYVHFLHMCSTLNNELVPKNSIMQIMHIAFFLTIKYSLTVEKETKGSCISTFF